jgi:hypothetical protein
MFLKLKFSLVHLLILRNSLDHITFHKNFRSSDCRSARQRRIFVDEISGDRRSMPGRPQQLVRRRHQMARRRMVTISV